MAKVTGIVQLQVNTNNDYVVNIMTRWVERWIACGWRKADGSRLMNLKDIKELYGLCNDGSVEVKWVSEFHLRRIAIQPLPLSPLEEPGGRRERQQRSR